MKRFIIGLVFGPIVVGCGGGDPTVETTKTAVMQTLEFERETQNGVSAGMNLDGLVSPPNDGRSCNKPDFTGPSGEPGVDNELARLLPLVDLAGENAVEGLIQGAINEGQLLVLLDVTRHEDGTADVVARRGADIPLLGTDGFILGGQTLGLHENAALGNTTGTFLDDHTMETAPFKVLLPIIVFTQLYVVELQDAIFRVTFDDQGYIESGLIAGGLPVEQLVQVLETAGNFGPEFVEIFGDAVRESGDLKRDAAGNCTWMSAAVTFLSVPAFTFAP